MSKIVFLGDSITLGVRTGVTATDIFSYKIGTSRGFSHIVNKGVANDTAAGGLARLNTDVISESPKACVVMFGTNDVYYSHTVANYKSNMKSIIQGLKAAGIEVLVLSPYFGRSTPQINAFPPYLAALAEACKEEGVPLIEIYRRLTHDYFIMSSGTWTGLYVDWAHPSVAGHTYITNIVLEAVNNDLILS